MFYFSLWPDTLHKNVLPVIEVWRLSQVGKSGLSPLLLYFKAADDLRAGASHPS